MKRHICATAIYATALPAYGQGILTPQGLTQAGAGGPVSGTIPHGVTYPSPPPVNNAGVNSQPIAPAVPVTGDTSQDLFGIPVLKSRAPKGRAPGKRKLSSGGSKRYDLGVGETPSIMIEDKPAR